jgi:hypothetical protein
MTHGITTNTRRSAKTSRAHTLAGEFPRIRILRNRAGDPRYAVDPRPPPPNRYGIVLAGSWEAALTHSAGRPSSSRPSRKQRERSGSPNGWHVRHVRHCGASVWRLGQRRSVYGRAHDSSRSKRPPTVVRIGKARRRVGGGSRGRFRPWM